MKASEYALRFKAAGSTIEAAGRVAMDMIMEVKELVQKRHAQTSEAFVAILDELQKKWEAFVRKAGPINDGTTINPDGFKKMVEARMPEMFSAWSLFKAIEKSRRQMGVKI